MVNYFVNFWTEDLLMVEYGVPVQCCTIYHADILSAVSGSI